MKKKEPSKRKQQRQNRVYPQVPGRNPGDNFSGEQRFLVALWGDKGKDLTGSFVLGPDNLSEVLRGSNGIDRLFDPENAASLRMFRKMWLFCGAQVSTDLQAEAAEYLLKEAVPLVNKEMMRADPGVWDPYPSGMTADELIRRFQKTMAYWSPPMTFHVGRFLDQYPESDLSELLPMPNRFNARYFFGWTFCTLTSGPSFLEELRRLDGISEKPIKMWGPYDD